MYSELVNAVNKMFSPSENPVAYIMASIPMLAYLGNQGYGYIITLRVRRAIRNKVPPFEDGQLALDLLGNRKFNREYALYLRDYAKQV